MGWNAEDVWKAFNSSTKINPRLRNEHRVKLLFVAALLEIAEAIDSLKGVIMDAKEGSGIVPQTGSQASIMQRLDALEKENQQLKIEVETAKKIVDAIKKQIGPNGQLTQPAG